MGRGALREEASLLQATLWEMQPFPWGLRWKQFLSPFVSGGSPAGAGPRDTTAAIMHLGINTYPYANQHLGWTLPH